MNYTPAARKADFDSEKEWCRLHALVESAEARVEGPEVTEELQKAVAGEGARREGAERTGAGQSNSQE
jgi:hypothetical protein